MMNIETAWARIEAHAGETFRLKRGDPLVYRIERDNVVPQHTPHWISKTQIARALPYIGRAQGPTDLPDSGVRSYIYAILADKRIRGNDYSLSTRPG